MTLIPNAYQPIALEAYSAVLPPAGPGLQARGPCTDLRGLIHKPIFSKIAAAPPDPLWSRRFFSQHNTRSSAYGDIVAARTTQWATHTHPIITYLTHVLGTSPWNEMERSFSVLFTAPISPMCTILSLLRAARWLHGPCDRLTPKLSTLTLISHASPRYEFMSSYLLSLLCVPVAL
ncbi:hypothetical protein BOTBODRAFT_553197 [Botryobasidium botryosum FD-172 SS1]|uniref:Uncharacterized protein n=1 Tax=Botryobasidium botryosum (strain FD-172 SS1) TaxID=930990 RepID=A0A067MR36_BOTB1|nr:hypothetical protein BOTBODRAFT_553197 [Botryobasidium botryosum FD-172 SS1]